MRARAAAAWLLIALIGAWVAPPPAAIAGEAVSLLDPALETRIKHLEEELRCLVCQGQSIAESDSGFAHDIRAEIVSMMRAGKSDREIIDFLVQRYGDFILFRPPVKSTTALLWAGPLILLAVGVVLMAVMILRQRRAPRPELSAEEVRRAESLLGVEEAKDKGGS
ncbi:MAG: cytochrome c-type biogenesis protein CcmH [Gammaproteobacteria bacterium]|nr:cytochrome c-type biogenesis protein CcmH [Gammaproteobacteria bacterium]